MIAVALVLASGLPSWLHWLEELWFPETGRWYAIGSSWAGATAILTGVLVFWHKHNCHEHRCLRLSWHPDTEGHPVCKKHHPDHPSRGLWWAIKHFVTTGHLGDHDHPRHAKHQTPAPEASG